MISFGWRRRLGGKIVTRQSAKHHRMQPPPMRAQGSMGSPLRPTIGM